jgi:hypothetical protein
VVTKPIQLRPDAAARPAPAIKVRFGHVHAVDLNPADGSVFAATHHGVFRLAPEGAVQAGLAHDMMGFAITGPDRFISSGHERA